MFSPEELVLKGIKASIGHMSLEPLLKSIRTALTSYKSICKETATVFSCDSFCRPHLEAQLRLMQSLYKAYGGRVYFANYPVSHYLTSQPNAEVLANASRPSKLTQLNKQLIESQTNEKAYPPSLLITNNSQIAVDQIDDSLEYLYELLPHDCYQRVRIDGFPFDELCLRDLSLTYKLLPNETIEIGSLAHMLLVDSIRLNIWLLIQLICQAVTGQSCFYMSFYSACGVFKFFCDQISVRSRYFDSIAIPLHYLGKEDSQYLRILKSPSQRIYSSHPEIVKELKLIKPSSKLIGKINEYIDTRLAGKGAHVYSSALKGEATGSKEIDKKRQKIKNAGGKFVTMFTSSDDECIGQQIAYVHDKVSTKHLHDSIFSDQKEWIEETVTYFAERRPKDLLVIRFHPRLAADKRGLPASASFAQSWQDITTRYANAKNIIFIHPSDPISSYSLGMKSDLVLNGWSTIGLELSMKNRLVTNAFYRCIKGGAPIYAVQNSTPILYTPNAYFKRIEMLLRDEVPNEASLSVVSQEDALKALLLCFCSGIVDIENPNQLRSQICSPVLLTPAFFSLFA